MIWAINILSGCLRPFLLFFTGRRAQVKGTRPSTPSVSGTAEGREVRARGRQPMRTWSQVGREKWAGPPSIPPGVKGEGKGARSRAREGSEGGRGIEVGSVGSQPCTPTASLVKLFALSSPLSISYSSISFSLTLRRLSLATRGLYVSPSCRDPIFFIFDLASLFFIFMQGIDLMVLW